MLREGDLSCVDVGSKYYFQDKHGCSLQTGFIRMKVIGCHLVEIYEQILEM